MCSIVLFTVLGFAVTVTTVMSVFSAVSSLVAIPFAGFFLYTPDIEPNIIRANYTNIDSKFTTVKGVEVHYRDQGNKDSKHPIILLLHGAFSSLFTWEPWIPYLKSDFRLISVDLPGQGVTGPHPAYPSTTEGHANFVEDFLKDINLIDKEFYFIGNSYGGAIAITFYNNNTKTKISIKKMVLIASSGYPIAKKPRVVRWARIPIARQIIRYVTPKRWIKSSLEEIYVDKSKVTEKYIQRTYDLLLRKGNREAMLDKIDHFNDETDAQLVQKIKNVDIPTLLLWGRNDTWIPIEFATRFQKDLPESKLIIYDDIGHVPHEENPQQLAEDTKEFLLS